MQRYSYTAEKAGGEIYKGVAEAADRFELYQLIRQEGGHLRAFDVEGGAGKFWSMNYWNEKFSGISEQQKILFARNLGSMIKAGLPLSRALSVIVRQTNNIKLKNTVAEVATDVRRGDALHIALGKFPRVFSKLMVAMVRAGEEGGDLSSSLVIVADQMERASDLKKKIRGALIYPSIILIAIFGIGALMMIYVVPTLSHTFKEMGATLPFTTQLIIGLSDFLVQYTIVAIGLVIACVAAVYVGLKSAQGKRALDWAVLHMPAISAIAKEVNAARTARTLASLVSAGVDVMTGLEITAEVVQNSYFREVLKDAREGIGQGQPLSTIFMRNEHLYPSFVGEMMAVGEETGQTTDMLKNLAEFYEAEVDRKTKNMSTIIEPLIMLFVGAGVGFFAISMITPIYQIGQNI